MIGSINDKIIGPLIVGGKGDLTDDKLIILENTIELSGLSIGPNDSMCCPPSPKQKYSNFHKGGSVRSNHRWVTLLCAQIRALRVLGSAYGATLSSAFGLMRESCRIAPGS
jgi:hypothetical protein